MKKRYRHNCPQCSFSSDSEAKVQFHLDTHVEGVLFVCDSCDFTSSTARILNRHRTREHTVKEVKPKRRRTVPTAKTPVMNVEFLSPALEMAEAGEDEEEEEEEENENENGEEEEMEEGEEEVNDNNEEEISESQPVGGRRNSSNNKLHCSYCPYKSVRPWDVKRHERIHTGEKPFKCRFCEYRSGDSCTRNSHERIHHNVIRTPGKRGPTSTTLAASSLLKKAVKSRNGLPQMPRMIPRPASFPSSIKRDPSEPLKTYMHVFKCELCSYKTYNAGEILAHVELHEGNNDFETKELICAYCLFSTDSERELTAHQRIHLPEVLMKMEEATAPSSRKKQQQQIQRVVPKLVLKTSSQFPSLHNNNKKPQRPGPQIYRCSKCSYKTSNKGCIIQHQQVHSDVKPFKCKYCPHASKRKYDIRKHERIHTG